MSAPTVSRRDVIAGAGAFVLGFYLPPRASQAQTAPAHGAAWYTDPAVPEINAWIVVEPDAAPRSKLPVHLLDSRRTGVRVDFSSHSQDLHSFTSVGRIRGVGRADARALDPKGSFRDAVEDAREGAEPLLDRIQHLLNHVGACVVLVAEVARDRRQLDSDERQRSTCRCRIVPFTA